jgi:hypothetical protein
VPALMSGFSSVGWQLVKLTQSHKREREIRLFLSIVSYFLSFTIRVLSLKTKETKDLSYKTKGLVLATKETKCLACVTKGLVLATKETKDLSCKTKGLVLVTK